MGALRGVEGKGGRGGAFQSRATGSDRSSVEVTDTSLIAPRRAHVDFS